jgi:hypothetical protein
LIIGGGLSGLAAALRFSRFIPDVLLLEKHSRVGGLNSYYYRNNRLFETGLHAITNYAPPKVKNAPLNRLLRQLKIKRKELDLHQQNQSEIRFLDHESLLFSNDFSLFDAEIGSKFPGSHAGFSKLLQLIDEYDPFKPLPFISAKKVIQEHVQDELLTEMLLCPLMYYGSSIENDMDLGQFVIMFRAVPSEPGHLLSASSIVARKSVVFSLLMEKKSAVIIFFQPLVRKKLLHSLGSHPDSNHCHAWVLLKQSLNFPLKQFSPTDMIALLFSIMLPNHSPTSSRKV